MLTKNIFLCALIHCMLLKAGAQTKSGVFMAAADDLVQLLPKRSFHAQVIPDSSGAGMNLFISNPAKQRLQLTISHKVLGAAVDTMISCEQFRTHYLFNQAADGTYKVVVRHQKEKFAKEIELSTVTSRCVRVY